jgi:hypothetical protein
MPPVSLKGGYVENEIKGKSAEITGAFGAV